MSTGERCSRCVLSSLRRLTLRRPPCRAAPRREALLVQCCDDRSHLVLLFCLFGASRGEPPRALRALGRGAHPARLLCRRDASELHVLELGVDARHDVACELVEVEDPVRVSVVPARGVDAEQVGRHRQPERATLVGVCQLEGVDSPLQVVRRQWRYGVEQTQRRGRLDKTDPVLVLVVPGRVQPAEQRPLGRREAFQHGDEGVEVHPPGGLLPLGDRIV
eukprot:scaffold21212_cov101-Isochrysis_galbana.AAC.3